MSKSLEEEINRPLSNAMEDDSSDDANDDDDDPIVKRYQVYLTNKLAEHLYLLQYPLRNKEQPFDYDTLNAVRFKPEHKKMDIEFELNEDNGHYDSQNSSMKNIVYSSKNVPVKTNYAVGVVRGTHLHITPLQNIIQLRPNLDHLKGSFATEKLDEKKEKSQPQAVQTNFRTQADEKARTKTFEYMKQQEDMEPSINMKMYLKDETPSRQAFEMLFANSEQRIKFDVTPSHYLNNLVKTQGHGLNQISLHSLQALPAEKQVQHSLFAAGILSFSRIKELAFRAKDDEQLISLIEDNAYLVDGRWVLKSHLKQLKPHLHHQSQKFVTTKETVLRDYMLYIFNKQGYVDRINFTDKTKAKKDTVLTLLQEIAVVEKDLSPDSNRGGRWVLKVPKDEDFEANFPHVVQRQQQLWQERSQSLTRMVNDGFKGVNKPVHATGMGVNREKEISTALTLMIKQVFKEHGVATREEIIQRFTAQKISNAVLSEATTDQFKKILDESVAIFYNDYIIFKHAELPETEPVREAIIQLFQKDPEMGYSEQDISEQLEKELETKQVSTSLNRVAARAKILQELADFNVSTGEYRPKRPVRTHHTAAK